MEVELYSHPDKKLFAHLKNVADAMVYYLKSIKISDFWLLSDKRIMENIVYLIGIAHDFGKATKHFQKYIRGDEETRKKLRGKEETRHSFISSIFALYLTERYLENTNLPDFTKKLLSLFSYLVVRRHHSNLKAARSDVIGLEETKYATKKLNDMDPSAVENLYIQLLEKKGVSIGDFRFRDFKNWLNSFDRGKIHVLLSTLNNVSKQKSLEFFFFVNLIYSFLLDADKKDAAGLAIHIPRKDVSPELIDIYKQKKFMKVLESDGINKLREEIYRKVTEKLEKIDIRNERIFTLEAFTGAGKTLTALSFALKLREIIKQREGITPRIIYALPFLTIIDQNSQVIEEVFNTSNITPTTDLLLKHHHLADIDYTWSKETITTFESEFIQDPLEIEKALLLIESWESELIITTFVQFFHSIITNRNRALKKFHNILNSIIILDEIQSIPYKYWGLLHDALNFLARKANTWIVLMTATMPLIFSPDEKNVKKLLEDSEKYYKTLNRIEMHVDLQNKSLDDFKVDLLNEIKSNPQKDFLIVLNTINSSKEVFEFLKESLSDNDIELSYLSTAVPPIERHKRIEAYRKDNGKQKVLVSTQLVEAGVDITADIVYRDFAPLDSIIQSAGRCNRNSTKRKGIVKVVLLIDKKNNRERPFSQYIYDSFLLDKTKETLKEFGRNIIYEHDLYPLMKKYYSKVKDFMSDKESREILNVIYNLEFERTREFRLIEEKGTTYDVFIELDEKAKQLREKFVEILCIKDKNARRVEWLKIKNEFYKYVVSVRSEEALSLPLLGNAFFIVQHEVLDEWYDEATGFGRNIKTLVY